MDRPKIVAITSAVLLVIVTAVVVMFNPATPQAQQLPLPGPVQTIIKEVPVPGPVRTIIERIPGPVETVYREVPGPVRTVLVPGPTVTVTETVLVPGPTRTITQTPQGSTGPIGQTPRPRATVTPVPIPTPSPVQGPTRRIEVSVPEAIGITTAALIAGILLGLVGVFIAYYAGRKDEERAEATAWESFRNDILRR